MTNREIFAKMTLTCAKVAKLQKEQNEAIEVIKDCFCQTGIMYHPANELPPEPAPKYDPNRKFRAGDIVEPCQVKGRWFGTAWEHRKGIHFTVVEDEDKTGTISVKDPDSVIERYVDAVYFQLVTPVEELEPYRVDTFEDTYYISYECGIAARYDSAYHPNAKAAAEAECARLNAEYRKEQE